MSDEGITLTNQGKIVDATVEELLSAVRGLLEDESDRATSLNSRASALTGFIGVILSIAVATGVALGRDSGAALHHWVRVTIGILIVLALALLLGAVIAVVAKVLIPTEGFTIARSEVTRYPNWEFVSRDHVMIQGHLMKAYVKALERDRERHASKAMWLGRGYKLVCAALILLTLAGAAATIDRYVAARRPQGASGGDRGTRHHHTGPVRKPIHHHS